MNKQDEPVVTDQYSSSGPSGVRLSEDLQVVAIDFESMKQPGTALRVGFPSPELAQLQSALAFVEKRLLEAKAGNTRSGH